ncbi:MAG: hypothetical protein WAZ27_02190 [Minisyncoccia bacterium]
MGFPLTTAHAEYTCGSGSVPAGAVCCSSSTYCNRGHTCGDGNECIPNSSPRACGGGKFCSEGSVCAPEKGKCVSIKAARYCGGKKFCKQDQACVDNGKSCVPLSSERYCGDGKYCQVGSYCKDGGCRSHEADAAEKALEQSVRELEEMERRFAEAAREAELERERTQAEKAPKPQPAPSNCGSDISGTGGPAAQRQNCDNARTGIACAPGSDCLKKAKWTDSEPYNHDSAPITFRQFNGAEIILKMGETLWSVPEKGFTGRRLEARKWDGKTSGANCRVEYANTTTEAFMVGIGCELERQAKLQSEFEAREDSYPYMHEEDCKPPATIRRNDGWESKSLQYWKDNPKEPVGWCDKPARDNRTDSRPLREPNWHTSKECSEDILGTAMPMSVSSRGVRGCKFIE